MYALLYWGRVRYHLMDNMLTTRQTNAATRAGDGPVVRCTFKNRPGPARARHASSITAKSAHVARRNRLRKEPRIHHFMLDGPLSSVDIWERTNKLSF